ncbi:hypothetical protein [Nocardia sp. NBC_00511]|uniref:phage fiber-tail adaptor protein n=1 Tax=Nocardia sp. NBC_00511 TaxID=2903591 RepID=UPI0030DEBFEE
MVFETKIKDPAETLDYKFDWGSPGSAQPYLEPGETISAYTLGFPDGLTPEPGDAIVDGGRDVLFWVSGGTLGVTYGVTCLITTNASRTAKRTMPIRIELR